MAESGGGVVGTHSASWLGEGHMPPRRNSLCKGPNVLSVPECPQEQGFVPLVRKGTRHKSLQLRSVMTGPWAVSLAGEASQAQGGEGA